MTTALYSIPNLLQGLPHMKINAFKATQYTPFLLATYSNKVALANLLKKYGASTGAAGQEVTFNRELIMAQTTFLLCPLINTLNHTTTIIMVIKTIIIIKAILGWIWSPSKP